MQDVIIKLNKESGSEEITISVPQSWNELKPYQLLYIAKYWQSWMDMITQSLSLTKARAALFLELSGLESRKDKKKLCFYLSCVGEDVDVNILDLTNFIFEKLDLTANLLPKIKVGFLTHFYGPKDNLSDLTLEEFSFAFNSYLQYSNFKHEADLNDLFAILYRPKNSESSYKTSGDFKVPFNVKLVDSYLPRAANVPFEYKEAVYIYFRGCIESLAAIFKPVFERSESDKKNSNKTFLDTMLNISGGKLGNFDETKNQNLHLALKYLTDLIIESQNNNKK